MFVPTWRFRFGSQDPTSACKLIDFGLVSLDDCDDGEKWVKGTQIFMAPEQFLQGAGAVT